MGWFNEFSLLETPSYCPILTQPMPEPARACNAMKTRDAALLAVGFVKALLLLSPFAAFAQSSHSCPSADGHPETMKTFPSFTCRGTACRPRTRWVGQALPVHVFQSRKNSAVESRQNGDSGRYCTPSETNRGSIARSITLSNLSQEQPAEAGAGSHPGIGTSASAGGADRLSGVAFRICSRVCARYCARTK